MATGGRPGKPDPPRESARWNPSRYGAAGSNSGRGDRDAGRIRSRRPTASVARQATVGQPVSATAATSATWADWSDAFDGPRDDGIEGGTAASRSQHRRSRHRWRDAHDDLLDDRIRLRRAANLCAARRARRSQGSVRWAGHHRQDAPCSGEGDRHGVAATRRAIEPCHRPSAVRARSRRCGPVDVFRGRAQASRCQPRSRSGGQPRIFRCRKVVGVERGPAGRSAAGEAWLRSPPGGGSAVVSSILAGPDRGYDPTACAAPWSTPACSGRLYVTAIENPNSPRKHSVLPSRPDSVAQGRIAVSAGTATWADSPPWPRPRSPPGTARKPWLPDPRADLSTPRP